MKGDILFLAHRLPFPPDRGDKIRSHHVLKALARLGRVHVGCFAESDADRAALGELDAVASSYCCPDRSKPLPVAGVEALLGGVPVSFAAFGHKELAAWVKAKLSSGEIETVYVFSGQMMQYIPEGWPKNDAGRLIVDLVDVDSAKFEALAQQKSGSHFSPMAWVQAREARLLRTVEEQAAYRADHTLLVSEEEAQLLRERVTDPKKARISALRNGIDFDEFDPSKVSAHEALTENGPHFVFTGQMDYAPNIAAVERMAKAIMPIIRERKPEAQFHIVGRAPVKDVLALGGQNGTRVWGAVPDVRPFVLGASCVVAPLTIARGVQNKVLEAMAMARPVLISPEAATGIPAVHGEHFLIAESDEALAEQALALLADPARAEQLGKAARDFVTGEMSWPAMLADLPALIGKKTSSRNAPETAARDAA